jgi:hypothetical protein
VTTVELDRFSTTCFADPGEMDRQLPDEAPLHHRDGCADVAVTVTAA